ncbi:MAG: TolC family protein [Thermoguttaceae bacterium]
MLIPYEQRVQSVDEQNSLRMAKTQEEIPLGFEPWWNQYVFKPLWGNSRALTIDVPSLMFGAMRHSPKVLALSVIPEIAQTNVAEAAATFDARAFLESKFIRTSDPVTNILTTGDSPRFRDQNWYYSGGVRRKTAFGGEFEASQRFGFEDNNSIYYQAPTDIPVPQGSAKLAFSYTQPLLNGAGREYNESIIVLAAIETGAATEQFAADLQNHLLEVNKAYWDLYLQRVALLEKRRLLQQADKLLGDLEARKTFDANQGQIVRAKSAVESRRAAIIRYATAVRNAEAKINLLVNDPKLFSPDRAELIPIDTLNIQFPNISLRNSLIVALYNRPEVNQVFQQIKAAGVREQIACKDLLPVLDAILATYVTGLETDSRMDQAWVDQFYIGEPSYTAGLQFELPFGNRAAKARLRKRQLELQQFGFQLKQTVAVLVQETEVAVRDVEAAYCEAQSQYLAMVAANVEVDYLDERWRLLPSEEQVSGIVLQDLLDAQERSGNAEIAFAASQVAYYMSLANLNRATGILLKSLSDPSSAGQAFGGKGPLEEIPSPPSDVIAPLPPVTNLPPKPVASPTVKDNSASLPSKSARPLDTQRQSETNSGKSPAKSQPRAKKAFLPSGKVASTAPMPPDTSLAPLPPRITTVPVNSSHPSTRK